jgi:hypothetical protein
MELRGAANHPKHSGEELAALLSGPSTPPPEEFAPRLRRDPGGTFRYVERFELPSEGMSAEPLLPLDMAQSIPIRFMAGPSLKAKLLGVPLL